MSAAVLGRLVVTVTLQFESADSRSRSESVNHLLRLRPRDPLKEQFQVGRVGGMRQEIVALNMEFSIVENLSGLCRSILNLFSGPTSIMWKSKRRLTVNNLLNLSLVFHFLIFPIQ